MITPSLLQAPPRGLGALARVVGGPPVSSIRLRFPVAKNPSERLSGDQKGKEAPSDPSTGRPASESSGRTYSKLLPESSIPTNARVFPSGEISGGWPAIRNVFSRGSI